MQLSPDEAVFWEHGFAKLNATIVTTWGLMMALGLGAYVITRRLSSELEISPWQNFLEIIVTGIQDQIREIGLEETEHYLPFIGTLFIFITTANICAIIPGYEAPTGSLSTTAALAICVFMAVPFFGIQASGLAGYLKTYLEPTFIMLPFNIIGEVSRTLALAVRLFGNIMSGAMIMGITIALAPLFFPILFHALELLTGIIQAYIFSILATVYIAAATADHKPKSLITNQSLQPENN
ncbi:MAG: F0F1 ATP synthase subunit A [Roseibacillus sp.]